MGENVRKRARAERGMSKGRKIWCKKQPIASLFMAFRKLESEYLKATKNSEKRKSNNEGQGFINTPDETSNGLQLNQED